jgi:hypothetical protein
MNTDTDLDQRTWLGASNWMVARMSAASASFSENSARSCDLPSSGFRVNLSTPADRDAQRENPKIHQKSDACSQQCSRHVRRLRSASLVDSISERLTAASVRCLHESASRIRRSMCKHTSASMDASTKVLWRQYSERLITHQARCR